jgi:hypothetical protein
MDSSFRWDPASNELQLTFRNPDATAQFQKGGRGDWPQIPLTPGKTA